MGLFDFFKPKKATPSPSAKSKSGKVYSGRGGVSGKPNIVSDLQMGLGFLPKDESYIARTKATQERMRKETLEQAQRNKDDRPKKPAAPQKTQAEIKKETEIAEGQARRKKFEQEAAERRRKFKARTGQRLLFSSLSLNS